MHRTAVQSRFETTRFLVLAALVAAPLAMIGCGNSAHGVRDDAGSDARSGDAANDAPSNDANPGVDSNVDDAMVDSSVDPNLCGTPPVVTNAGSPTVSGGVAGGTTSSLGAAAAYTCDNGYVIAGSDATCGANGQWSTPPTCTIYDCGAAPSLTDGSVTTPNGTTFGETAAYACDLGFILTGGTAVTCAVTGWTGTLPTCADDPCLPLPCMNGGTCSPQGASYFCNCPNGWAGMDCMTADPNECMDDTDTCTANEFCTNTIGGFVCTACGANEVVTGAPSNTEACACAPGYGGGVGACVDVDECTADTDGCLVNETCSNTTGSFTCTPCGANEVVSGAPGAAEICVCAPGYTLLGSSCVDIDECTTNTDNCTATEICANVAGAFTCTACGANEVVTGSPGPSEACACDSGYGGGAGNCTDIDECTANTDGCLANEICANNAGAFTCTACGANQTPTGAPGSESCACDSGYTMSGTTCVDVDECMTGTPCDANAACANSTGSYTCTCNDGYTGSGATCSPDTTYCPAPPTVSFSSGVTISGGLGGGSSTSLGATATYSCNNGYDLFGAPSTCGTGGVWSASPACAIHDCGAAPSLANGTTTTPTGTTFGEAAVFACGAGFLLDGGTPVTCGMSGWTGTLPTCIDDACLPNPCQNGGSCTPNGASYVCSCVSGWSGMDCEIADPDECVLDTDTCSSIEYCTNTIGSFTCTACGANEVVSGAPGPSESCACAAGYGGGAGNCTDIDECSADTDGCAAGSICTNTAGSFGCAACGANEVVSGAPGPSEACVCANGYTRVGSSCVDIDECAANTDTCSANQACVNNAGGFSCTTCGANEAVTGAPGSETCSCVSGYSRVGAACVDDDECSLDTDTCTSGQACVNSAGSFSCTTCGANQVVSGAPGPSEACVCVSGYTMSGGTCVDVNECSPVSPCAATATCTNSPGSYSCACNPGYVGTGTTCSADANYCAAPPSVSFASGIVVSGGIGGGATTSLGATAAYSCTTGYDYSGADAVCGIPGTWSAPPACTIHDCGAPPTILNGGAAPGGTTFGSSATYSCSAGYLPNGGSAVTCGASGWTGTPPTCIDDPCLPLPCLNGGTCSSTAGVYTCACPAGWSGTDCETQVFSCTPNPCLHGTCSLPGGMISCACDSGWSGGSCDVDVNECVLDTDGCGAGSICVNNAGSFSCTACGANEVVTGAPGASESCVCPAGFQVVGGVCTDVNECANNTDSCNANERCSNTSGSYTCTACGANEVVSGPPGSEVCTCAPGYALIGGVCTAWTVCNPGQYETTAPSASNDRVCGTCAAGTFSNTNNAVACTPCGANSFSAAGANSCTGWQTCAAGTYVSNTPSATVDRVCTACAGGTYSSTTNAASCSPWTLCGPGTYVTTTPSATQNRACTACGAGTYSLGPNDAACTTWSTCGSGTFVVAAPSATNDRGCQACAGGQFSTGPNAATCSNWSTCAAGTYVTNTPSASVDRTCAACTGSTYTSSANQTSCTAWQTCAAGTYVSNTPSASADRVCTTCAGGSFSTTTNAGTCSPWTTCVAGTFVSNTPSTTVDRTCGACTGSTYTSAPNQASCSTWTNCAAGSYVSNTPSNSVDRTCAACTGSTYTSSANQSACSPWTNCAAGNYVTNTPSNSVDRTCAACTGSTYTSSANQTTCSAWTNCAAGSYVNNTPSNSVDRTCAACTGSTYTSSANQSACSPWTNCAAGNYVTNTPSNSVDRTCAACTGSTYTASINQATCSNWTDCAAGTRVTNTPTNSVDRTCAACTGSTYTSSINQATCSNWTDCAAGTRVTNTPTNSVDRTCAACTGSTYTSSINQATCSNWTDCAAGTRVTNTPTNSVDRTCAACTGSTYTASINQATCSDWTDCAAGTRVTNTPTNSVDRTCAACTGSTYTASINQATCSNWTDCAAGTRVSNTPSSSVDRTCAACTGSTYTATANQSTCSNWTTCAAGSYVTNTPNNTTDRTCSSCAAGSYSTTTDAASCTLCAANTYSTTVGANTASTCLACASGYGSAAGATVCTDINECMGTNSCAVGTSMCTNTAGGYTCTCNAGYTGTGFVCTLVDCGALSNPANATVSTPMGTTYNQTATYTCNSGYVQSGGSTSRTCQAAGTWSGSPIVCAQQCAAYDVTYNLDTTTFVVDAVNNAGDHTSTVTPPYGNTLTNSSDLVIGSGTLVVRYPASATAYVGGPTSILTGTAVNARLISYTLNIDETWYPGLAATVHTNIVETAQYSSGTPTAGCGFATGSLNTTTGALTWSAPTKPWMHTTGNVSCSGFFCGFSSCSSSAPWIGAQNTYGMQTPGTMTFGGTHTYDQTFTAGNLNLGNDSCANTNVVWRTNAAPTVAACVTSTPASCTY